MYSMPLLVQPEAEYKEILLVPPKGKLIIIEKIEKAKSKQQKMKDKRREM